MIRGQAWVVFVGGEASEVVELLLLGLIIVDDTVELIDQVVRLQYYFPLTQVPREKGNEFVAMVKESILDALPEA
ncbi:hypothetical protein EV2_023879 [Malus domestica]